MNVSGQSNSTPSAAVSGTQASEHPDQNFTMLDRRKLQSSGVQTPVERRQFGNTHANISPDARELGNAIDQYKLMNRRRFVTYEEMLNVIKSLGYHK